MSIRRLIVAGLIEICLVLGVVRLAHASPQSLWWFQRFLNGSSALSAPPNAATPTPTGTKVPGLPTSTPTFTPIPGTAAVQTTCSISCTQPGEVIQCQITVSRVDPVSLQASELFHVQAPISLTNPVDTQTMKWFNLQIPAGTASPATLSRNWIVSLHQRLVSVVGPCVVTKP